MALPEPKGYRRLSPRELEGLGLSGKSRAVRTPTGDIISRRQFENLRLQSRTPNQAGWRSWSQFQLSRKSKLYQYDIGLALKNHPEVDRKEMRKIDSDFNRLYIESRPLFKDRKSNAYRDPNGLVAQYLTYLGLRDEGDAWDVGETQHD